MRFSVAAWHVWAIFPYVSWTAETAQWKVFCPAQDSHSYRERLFDELKMFSMLLKLKQSYRIAMPVVSLCGVSYLSHSFMFHQKTKKNLHLYTMKVNQPLFLGSADQTSITISLGNRFHIATSHISAISHLFDGNKIPHKGKSSVFHTVTETDESVN